MGAPGSPRSSRLASRSRRWRVTAPSRRGVTAAMGAPAPRPAPGSQCLSRGPPTMVRLASVHGLTCGAQERLGHGGSVPACAPQNKAGFAPKCVRTQHGVLRPFWAILRNIVLDSLRLALVLPPSCLLPAYAVASLYVG